MNGEQYRVDIGGDATAPIVAGHNNVVISATGSSVNVLMPKEEPAPVRLERIELLPAQQPEPLGRASELATLSAALRNGGAVQLCGPFGVGKSTLLRYAARTFAGGPDGTIFVSAAGGEVSDVAQQIFEACYKPMGRPYLPLPTELRRLMTGVRVTVYVDDADLTLQQMRDLTDAVPDGTVVFAAAERSPLEGVTVLELAGLDRDSSLKLLRTSMNRSLSESETAAAEELWRAADGRPLLLKRAAGIAGEQPGALPKPGQIAEFVPMLRNHLDDTSKQILNLLATLEGAELSVAHIEGLCDGSGAARLCDRMVALGLLARTETGYCCALDIVTVLDDSDRYPIAGLCVYFTRWARRAGVERAEVAAAGPALEKVLELAQRAGQPKLAVALARATSPAMARALRFGMWGRLLGWGWLAAEESGDRAAAAYFMHEEGIRSMFTGRRVLAVALLAEAAVRWLELGNQHAATTAANAQQYLLPHDPTAISLGANGIGASPGSTTPVHAAASGHTAATHMTGLVVPPSGPHTVSLQLPHYAGSALTSAAGHGSSVGAAHTVAAKSVAASAGTNVVSGAAGVGGASAAAGSAVLAKAIAGVIAAVVFFVAGPRIIAEVRQAIESATEHGIVGTWNGPTGTFRITTSGSGRYTVPMKSEIGCSNREDVTLTGNDQSASGTAPIFDTSTCAIDGYGTITLSVSSDGNTLTETMSAPSSSNCENCDSRTYTRKH
ncbi:hypothetical protein NRB20_25860 [Nocardia sp. RB20]|uniref:Uncharacterized protein n=1 Tax=Nocardia macrotermitis TaxID=2585198 RepID=A0A7K0D187_9NOCA|nr:hypothetical protein [Nocardia macrotermitis]